MFRRWMQAFMGRGEKGIPQGLKPLSSDLAERPKAKALGYLEAKTHGEVSGGERARAEALAYLEATTHHQTKTRGRSLKRWVQAAMVCLLAVVMLGADASSRFNKM